MKNYDLALSEKIYDYYIESNMGFNETCMACKSHSKKRNHPLNYGPVPLFHIGNEFAKSEVRLLFVGTVAYGWSEIKDLFWIDDKITRINNKRETIEWVENRVDELFFHKNHDEKMRLFTFMREGSRILFGKDGYDKIAITNLAHCNEGLTENYLPQKVFDKCVLDPQTKYLLKEVEILNPTHVVLFSTSGKFTRYLKHVEALGIKTMSTKHPSRANFHNFIEALKSFIIN
jgi:hypothetical protein